ncbi:MAG: tetratricopeptide repeat protein [Acidobacteriaceae bacterium]
MFLPNGLKSTIEILRRFHTLVELLVVGIGIVLARFGLLQSRNSKAMSKGLDLQLAGKPAEAEKCFRIALNRGTKQQSDRVRLLVCLADALFDQGRYQESKQCLDQALTLGDPTGSGQASMSDVLLALKTSPQKAIEMADESMQLQGASPVTESFGAEWGKASRDLLEARTCARKARALLMLDRQAEARQALDRAVSILDASKSEVQLSNPEADVETKLILGDRLRRIKELTIAGTSWQVGLALLAMGDKDKAAEQFLIVRDTDHMGKYRSLAQKELDSLGYPGTVAPAFA